MISEAHMSTVDTLDDNKNLMHIFRWDNEVYIMYVYEAHDWNMCHVFYLRRKQNYSILANIKRKLGQSTHTSSVPPPLHLFRKQHMDKLGIYIIHCQPTRCYLPFKFQYRPKTDGMRTSALLLSVMYKTRIFMCEVVGQQSQTDNHDKFTSVGYFS